MIKDYVEFAKKIRHTLHEIPEPSMHELQTKQALMDIMKNETNLTVVDCGNWFYAVWNGGTSDLCANQAQYTEDATKDTARKDAIEGAIALRADYDAVTGADGVSRHICGHDGHASILAAFGKWIADHKPARSIILLFQPGEESGEGALVCRELFQREKVKEIYGFHNIPGFPEGKILLKKGTFACASTGLCIHFQGAPSHAAYPEYGKNPAAAVAELILKIENYINQITHRGILLSTVIGIDLGSESYGVSASEGTLRLTVRAEYQEEFDSLLSFIVHKMEEVGRKYELRTEYTEVERFPSTENHSECVGKLRQILSEKADAGLSYEMMEEPRRWSEDFGWYLKEIPGALVGIGAGKEWPQLHTENYEFNDSIIYTALKFYESITIHSDN